MKVKIDKLIELLDSIVDKAKKTGLSLDEELAAIVIKSHLNNLNGDISYDQ